MTAPLKDIDSKRLVVEIANQLNQYHMDALKEVPRELDPYIQPILDLITKEKIKELERLANEPSTPPDCPKECKSKHWHHVVVGNIKYRISELKQQLGGKG